jgi:hypothetical protein
MRNHLIILAILSIITVTLAYMVWNKSQDPAPVNKGVEAKLVLEVDSCKVYQFYSNGHAVFLAVRGKSVSISR